MNRGIFIDRAIARTLTDARNADSSDDHDLPALIFSICVLVIPSILLTLGCIAAVFLFQ